MANWNPWHGCRKYSEGCQNCYVYRIDSAHGKDASQIFLNREFDLPMRRGRKGYLLAPGTNLQFFIITKRVLRMQDCLPPDWGEGYENVQICCTVENQRQAQLRLPVYQQLPIRHKSIICSPLLSAIDLSTYLGSWVEEVTVGGESGEQARLCDYRWVLDIRRQCVQAQVPFYFMQTGARLLKDGKLYHIPRKHQHSQARAAAIDFLPAEQLPWQAF